MRTEDLQYFLAVAAVGKLGPASDMLGISQPGLTKAIVRLETELGGALFLRTGRGMQLTELGQAFERRARRMTQEVGEALVEARRLQPLEGVLRLGVAPAIVPMSVVASAEMMRRRPLLRIDLMIQVTDYLEIALSSGRIDLAIATQSELFAKEFSFQPVAEDEIRIVCAADHPLAGRDLGLADLAGQAWALPHRDIAMRRHLDQIFRNSAQPEPLVRMEWEWGAGIYELIARSRLLSISNPYLYGLAPPGAMRVLKVRDFAWKRQVGLLTRKGETLAPIAQDYADWFLAGPARPMMFD